MRAVQVTELAGPRSVTVDELDEPRGSGVLIDVHAAGVTFPDVLVTHGRYQVKPPLPFIPGSEVAGVIRAAPPDSDLEVGQRVAAFTGFGGFAEVVHVSDHLVFPIPDDLAMEAAAGMPMNVLTVDFALRRRTQLRAGERVLVHGAAGGIGVAAIQLAKALDAHVIAVTSTPEKAEFARSVGADEVVEVEGFKDAVLDLTDGRGVDVVVDPVGGDRFTDSLRSLDTDGRLLVIGFTAGEIPTVKVNRLLLSNLSVVGVGWGAYWQGDLGFPRRQWDELRPLIDEGALDPPIGGRFSLTDAAEALGAIENRTALGKLVLTVPR